MTAAEFKTQIPVKPQIAFPHVLIATDFSEASQRALCSALTLAGDTAAEFSIIHVLQPDWRYATLEKPPEIDLQRVDAEQQLKSLIQNVPHRDIHIVLVRNPHVAEAVASVINESDVDLLVLGTRGRGGLSKFALGSVAEELLRLAPCPVMTFGPKADVASRLHGPGFHSILFATDFGPGSIAALPLTLALARTHQAKLILLHMIPPMPATAGSLSAYAPPAAAADELEEWETATRKRALQRLKQCLPKGTELDQAPEYVVGTDFLPEGILTAADRFKVDLIVMGANRAGAPRAAAHTPWSAVHEIVSRAACPVLTVAG